MNARQREIQRAQVFHKIANAERRLRDSLDAAMLAETEEAYVDALYNLEKATHDFTVWSITLRALGKR